MMISPECYYEENLKGKTVSEIEAEIQLLKIEITRLKEILEHPDYECKQKPSELTQLLCGEAYLERAKQVLADAGGVYAPTAEDYNVIAFNKQLEHLHKVTFRFGAYLGGYKERTITIENGKTLLQSKFFPAVEKNAEAVYPFDSQDVISGLQKLKLGGWRHRYDTDRYGFFAFDGTGWRLELSFSNGLPSREFHGDNAFPYNFEKLRELFDDLWLESGLI